MRELVILEHVSYLISCIAETCTGEAKRQIGPLIERVKNAPDLDPGVRNLVLEGLTEAETELRAGRGKSAAIGFWRISRTLWDRVMPASATDRYQQTLPAPWAKEIRPGSTLVSISFPPEIQTKMDKMRPRG